MERSTLLEVSTANEKDNIYQYTCTSLENSVKQHENKCNDMKILQVKTQFYKYYMC